MLNTSAGIKCVVFDLDGTVYFGKQLAPHALEMLAYARQRAGRIFFATNNSAKTPSEIYQRLRDRGIPLTPDEVITSSLLLTEYLLDKHLTRTITLGTASLKNFFRQHGIDPLSKQAQALVIGYDPDATVRDLDPCLNYLPSDYLFVAANTERCYPVENGWLTPGAGALVKMAEFVLQKPADVLIGKPSPVMLQWIARKLNLSPQQILMVGDQYASDIVMAEKFGAQALLITNNTPSDYPCKKAATLAGIKDLI